MSAINLQSEISSGLRLLEQEASAEKDPLRLSYLNMQIGFAHLLLADLQAFGNFNEMSDIMIVSTRIMRQEVRDKMVAWQP
jgi:hypothetical protein